MGDTNNVNESGNITATAVTTDPEVIKAMEKAQAKVDKKKSLKQLTESEIADMLGKIESNDMKIIAELIVELKKENDRTARYAKRQSICSLCSAVLCLILVSVILIWGVRFVPTVENLANEATLLLSNTNSLIADTQTIVDNALVVLDEATAMVEDTSVMLDQTAVVVDNLETITSDLANADIEGMLNNVNELVLTSEGSMEEAAKKIDDIDITSLNKAIKDLQAVVTPLSRLFKK